MKKLLSFPILIFILASCGADERNNSVYSSGIPAVSAYVLDFGKTAQHEKSAMKPLTIANLGGGTLTFNTTPPRDFAFDNASTCNFSVNSLELGKSCTYEIYAETISNGIVTDNLTITTDNTNFAILRVALTADATPTDIHPALRVTSDNVTLPATKKNVRSDNGTITFTNIGKRNLIFEVAIPEPFHAGSASTCSVKTKNTLGPLAKCDLIIYALSTKIGEISKATTVKANDPEKRDVPITLNVNITE